LKGLKLVERVEGFEKVEGDESLKFKVDSLGLRRLKDVS